MTIHILHHADSDGRFAGYCAWRYFRDNPAFDLKDVQFKEVQYQQAFPLDIESLTVNDQMYILDFSYDRETLDRVFAKVGFLKVLDHHESAEERLQGAPYVFFDKTKSGALLAWEYFFEDRSPPLACLLVNDFDMWAWKYAQTAAFEAYLHYDRVKQNWEKWDLLSTDAAAMDNAIKTGMILEQSNESAMRTIVFGGNLTYGNLSRAMTTEESDTFESPLLQNAVKVARYAAHNGMGILHSQLGSFICQEKQVDVSIGYRIKRDIVVFNVRSAENTAITAKMVATKFGGGGHPHAASFRLPLREGLDFVHQLHTCDEVAI
jgi:oligoribonuclease NrnB/cAMP/cGMP phosphodiesterase (DHH superfamily)